ncbi:hypothetical protein F5Y16DRAFT_423781 [Xylariaceae sp. FL0255]|nr:hypothetical protein F5Y16DRAFT_423781 [Xylariaceae sp. FL0255]
MEELQELVSVPFDQDPETSQDGSAPDYHQSLAFPEDLLISGYDPLWFEVDGALTPAAGLSDSEGLHDSQVFDEWHPQVTFTDQLSLPTRPSTGFSAVSTYYFNQDGYGDGVRTLEEVQGVAPNFALPESLDHPSLSANPWLNLETNNLFVDTELNMSDSVSGQASDTISSPTNYVTRDGSMAIALVTRQAPLSSSSSAIPNRRPGRILLPKPDHDSSDFKLAMKRQRSVTPPREYMGNCMILELRGLERPESWSAKRSKRDKTKKACLLCQLSRKKCSGTWPCSNCQRILNRAMSNKTIYWKRCVDSDILQKDDLLFTVLNDILDNPTNYNIYCTTNASFLISVMYFREESMYEANDRVAVDFINAIIIAMLKDGEKMRMRTLDEYLSLLPPAPSEWSVDTSQPRNLAAYSVEEIQAISEFKLCQSAIRYYRLISYLEFLSGMRQSIQDVKKHGFTAEEPWEFVLDAVATYAFTKSDVVQECLNIAQHQVKGNNVAITNTMSSNELDIRWLEDYIDHLASFIVVWVERCSTYEWYHSIVACTLLSLNSSYLLDPRQVRAVVNPLGATNSADSDSFQTEIAERDGRVIEHEGKTHQSQCPGSDLRVPTFKATSIKSDTNLGWEGSWYEQVHKPWWSIAAARLDTDESLKDPIDSMLAGANILFALQKQVKRGGKTNKTSLELIEDAAIESWEETKGAEAMRNSVHHYTRKQEGK